MEIDDILASVDRHDISNPQSTALDHQLLTRYWVAERSAPELLPWPEQLMERMMERVRQQIETIENLAAASSAEMMNSSTSNTTTHPNATATAANINLKLSILQTDLSRTQYLLRSFLRQRLAKLTKHSMYYLLQIASHDPSSSSSSTLSSSLLTSSNPDSAKHHQATQQPEDSVPVPDPAAHPAPLSRAEVDFLYTHQTLLARHYGASFLSSFPGQLRRLDDNAGGTSMVQGPDLREVVFVRCLVEESRVVVPVEDGNGAGGMGGVEMSGVTMRMGDVWVVRWEGVKGAWERGDVEVL
ncbi:hypothetical protein P175DRAFT_0516311 [Aspergillus ochraceoroseus IBT 24754]|uniref:DNA replication complex GINS protein SLD5 n=2 Tax=Aspergillus ochraceoroseus TaxID=138278 RepID=A0A2T5LWJ1_9EURO|nr:uncharacterized protein P175DRAFT_0516311 [Aspergillus ochraceoroseus IBT 24754]KKK22218.1 hypothetical protein AOCH_003961 [Aspergillus ochraceoroseus]PTU20647.1 hypothetical protein P175DRAFT_0516311 [Aspergillus ochraceoroseus IBT 24754]